MMLKKHIKVLLIEDNQGDVRLIWEILSEVRNSPFYLEVADSLLNGLNAIQKGKPDVVLLDLSLPDSNGIYTLNRVRDKAKDVPVVVMTGLDDEMTAIKALKEGAQDYLVKGRTDSDLLKRAIVYAIERNRMMLEVESNERKMDSVIGKMMSHDRIRGAVFSCLMEEIQSSCADEKMKKTALQLGEVLGRDIGPDSTGESSFTEILGAAFPGLKISSADTASVISCDRERLKAAFSMMLDEVTGQVSAEIKGRSVIFSAVSADNINKIIDAIGSYKRNEVPKSAAIGVYAACGMVELMGGTVEVMTEGENKKISVTMPAN